MVPILLILDSIIWYGVIKHYQYDRTYGPYPTNPMFDQDLDALWNAGWNPNLPDIKKQKQTEKDEDIILRQKLESWIEQDRKKDKTLEDYLWDEGIINPEETLWCEGELLEMGNPKDMKRFMRIKNKAMLEGIFNSKNLDDGGQHDLYRTWLMLKGCSDFGAEILLANGVNPWEFNFDS